MPVQTQVCKRQNGMTVSISDAVLQNRTDFSFSSGSAAFCSNPQHHESVQIFQVIILKYPHQRGYS